MVAVDRLAAVLGLGLRAIPALEVARCQRCAWMEDSDYLLLPRWVRFNDPFKSYNANYDSLPASPLWLTGMYAPQFAPLNKYLPPPTWFSVCIFFMEVFAI